MSQNDENTHLYPEGLCQHCHDPAQTAYKINLGNNIFKKQMEFFCFDVLNNVPLPDFLCKSCEETVKFFFDYKEMCITKKTEHFKKLLLKRPLGHTLDCECTRCGGNFTLNDENEECRKCKFCKKDLIQVGVNLPLMVLKKVTKKDGKKGDGQKDTKGRAKVAKNVAAAEPVVPRRSERVCSSLTVEDLQTSDDMNSSSGSRKRSRSTSGTASGTASSTEEGQKDTFVQPKGRAKVAKKVATADSVVPRRPKRGCSSLTVEDVPMNSNGISRRLELQSLQIQRSKTTSSTASSTASSTVSSTPSTRSRHAPKVIRSCTTGRKIV